MAATAAADLRTAAQQQQASRGAREKRREEQEGRKLHNRNRIFSPFPPNLLRKLFSLTIRIMNTSIHSRMPRHDVSLLPLSSTCLAPEAGAAGRATGRWGGQCIARSLLASPPGTSVGEGPTCSHLHSGVCDATQLGLGFGVAFSDSLPGFVAAAAAAVLLWWMRGSDAGRYAGEWDVR